MATITKKKGGAYRVKTGTQGNVDLYDEISLWTHASDVTFDDNQTLVQKLTGYATGTLQAGGYQVMVRSASGIPADSMIDIYVPDEYIRILVPETITRTQDGGVGITFPESVRTLITNDVEIRVRYH